MTALPSSEVQVGVVPGRRHLRLVPNKPEVTISGVSPRVYAKRRFAALLILFIVGGGALLAGKALALGSSAGSSVTVKPGQTLSEVAHEKLPDLPVADAVVKFQQLNNLSSMHVDAGEKLLVPAA